MLLVLLAGGLDSEPDCVCVDCDGVVSVIIELGLVQTRIILAWRMACSLGLGLALRTSGSSKLLTPLDVAATTTPAFVVGLDLCFPGRRLGSWMASTFVGRS